MRARRCQVVSKGRPVRGGSPMCGAAVRPRRRTATLAGAVPVSGPTVPGCRKSAKVRPGEGTRAARRATVLSRASSRRGSAARAATVRGVAPGITG
ncbi:hypothetical protein [Streptomyces sp. TRM49041]|uniref:hypothetical protein n=1 Tax=Streptomyces sp. TRM49041 TaxID=2603216 RepID=UPI0011EE39F7|nr:hypothetical protein [Streptomyces sp. TRM49041]